jgi:hypothetical protein
MIDTAAPLDMDIVIIAKRSARFMMPDFIADTPLMAWNQIGNC